MLKGENSLKKVFKGYKTPAVEKTRPVFNKARERCGGGVELIIFDRPLMPGWGTKAAIDQPNSMPANCRQLSTAFIRPLFVLAGRGSLHDLTVSTLVNHTKGEMLTQIQTFILNRRAFNTFTCRNTAASFYKRVA